MTSDFKKKKGFHRAIVILLVQVEESGVELSPQTLAGLLNGQDEIVSA